MAFDTFLKIDGVPGESTDSKHKDWIEITSFAHGVSQPVSATASSAGGAGAERVDHQDFHISKLLDKATPKLLEHCCDGKHIKEITVEFCRAGGDKFKYFEVKLSDVIVSSVSTSGSGQAAGEGFPTESVSFNYGKIAWTYSQQKRTDGSGGGNVQASWDLRLNKA